MQFAQHKPSSIVLRLHFGLVRSCRSDDSLQRVAEVMWKHSCDYLLIVDTDGHAVGMITIQQLFLAAKQQNKPLAHISVSSAVSRDGTVNTSIQQIANLESCSPQPYQRQVPNFDIEDCLVDIVRADWLARYLSTISASGSLAAAELPLPRE